MNNARRKGIIVLAVMLLGVSAVGAAARGLPRRGQEAAQAQMEVNHNPALENAQRLMTSTPANELVAQVVQNELNAKDEGHFMYRDWRQTPSGSKTKEMIETSDGVVARLIAINGQPLTPEEKDTEYARLQNLLSHPEVQRKNKKEQDQDADRVKRMFKQLPLAFNYQYAGVDGELIHLNFQPNPNFDPPSRETSVFKSMSGQMWVEPTDLRLARIEGTLFRSVNFGWGILGHLDKGGHFFVSQSKVGPNRWDATDMNIQFTGKALLFKTIDMRQVEKLSDFRRVPDNLTLGQAIDLLNKTDSQLAETAPEK